MPIAILAHPEPATDEAYPGRRSYVALEDAAAFRRIDVVACASADEAARALCDLSGPGTRGGAYEVVESGASEEAATEDAVVFVNCLAIAVGGEDDAYRRWKAVNDHMVTRPGYLTYTLHRRTGSDAPFAFVNVVGWRSFESFRAAPDARFAELTADLPFAPLTSLCRPAGDLAHLAHYVAHQ